MAKLQQKSTGTALEHNTDTEIDVCSSSSRRSHSDSVLGSAAAAKHTQQLLWTHHVLQEKRLQFTCDQFQLVRMPKITSVPEEHQNKVLAHCLEQLIAQECAQNTTVTIYKTDGDGNCLFRAISLGLTQSQDSHKLIRNYVINHLMDTAQSDNVDDIANMGRDGVWGTDQEITAAAELFNSWIFCCSRYGNSNQLCLQQFSPHGIEGRICTSDCQHPIIFLLNSSGAHYEYVAVKVKDVEE